jgi:hypothetical protein
MSLSAEEERLIDTLRKVEALFAGTTFAGEKASAAAAMERLRQKLRETQQHDAPVEFKFTLQDGWSRKLFMALLRRYDLQPYRYRGQRYTTVMVRVPRSFVDQTLWPEYLKLSEVLSSYLDDVTNRVIAEGVNADMSEAEERPQSPAMLPDPRKAR